MGHINDLCCTQISGYVPFGGIALKIEFVVFVYELINYEIILFITWLCNWCFIVH